MRAFGIALRTARDELGLSIEDLAGAIGRSVWTVRNYERGTHRPGLAVRAELISILGIDADDMKAAHAALRHTVPSGIAPTTHAPHLSRGKER